MGVCTDSAKRTNAPIRLPLPRPHQLLSVRELGAGRHLIHPTKKKFEWEIAERVYRSVIVDAAGRVLSTGFAKFGNYGEPPFADADRALDDAIGAGREVLVAEKLDGILAVRSVIDGVVIFRTRASADGSVFAEHMRAVAAERYRMAENGEVQRLAARHDLHATVWTPLAQGLTELCRQVRDWRGREGVVVRAGQHLIKIKAMSYLTQHRLLCDLSARRIRDTLEAVDLRTLVQVREHLEARGGDWEVLSDSGAIVQTLLDARSAAHIRFDALSAEATARAAELPDRKAFALQYAAALPAGAERAAAFLVADGRLGLALETLTAAALDETVERLHQAETVAALDEPSTSR